MLLNKSEFDKVEGEIYKITNTVNGKCYVGQTRSHRLNHDKYRPFGYLGRFRDHIHEANSSKKNQSWYLNSAILKYGADKFVCEQLLTCKLEELDEYEAYHIAECKSKYPTGYNLTDGGQGANFKKGEKIVLDESRLVKPEIKEKASLKKSDHTKQLISERLKQTFSDPTYRCKMMSRAQDQHLAKKFEPFRHTKIDQTDINQYIHVIRDNKANKEYVKIKIDRAKTTFVGKFETIEQIKERARNFITQLVKWQCDQIAGTPLEPSLPLSPGNAGEELG